MGKWMVCGQAAALSWAVSAQCPRLPAGVEKGETFFPAVSKHLAAASGLCPWVGGFSVFSHLPGRSCKDLWLGGRGSFLGSSFLRWLSYFLPGRKGETRLPSEFKWSASLGWYKFSDFTWLTILIALLGVADAFSFYVNRKEVFRKVPLHYWACDEKIWGP